MRVRGQPLRQLAALARLQLEQTGAAQHSRSICAGSVSGTGDEAACARTAIALSTCVTSAAAGGRGATASACVLQRAGFASQPLQDPEQQSESQPSMDERPAPSAPPLGEAVASGGVGAQHHAQPAAQQGDTARQQQRREWHQRQQRQRMQTPADIMVPADMADLRQASLQRLLMQMQDHQLHAEIVALMEKYVSHVEALPDDVRSAHPPTHPQSHVPSVVSWTIYVRALAECNRPPLFIKQTVANIKLQWGVTPTASMHSTVLRRCADVQPSARSARIAFNLMQQLATEGSGPNLNRYIWSLTACSNAYEMGMAMRLLQQLRASGLLSGAMSYSDRGRLREVLGQVANAAYRSGRVRDSMLVIDMMAELGLPVSPAMMVDIAQAAAASDDLEPLPALLESLWRVQREGAPLKLDQGTLLHLLNAAARNANTKVADMSWALLERSLSQRYHHLAPQAAAEAAAGGDAGAAAGAEAQPDERPPPTAVEPVVAAFHAIIHAYAAAGDFRAAFRMMRRLQLAYPLEPDQLAYNPAMAMVVDAMAASVDRIDEGYFTLESMRKEGEDVDITMLNCIIAACSQVGDLGRAFETLDAAGELGVEPNTDTYNAAAMGCVQHGRVDAVGQVLSEAEARGLQPNARTHEVAILSHVVSRDMPGLAAALQAAIAADMDVSISVLEAALARAEREGDTQLMAAAQAQLRAKQGYKVIGALAKYKRWERMGGMRTLTGSDKFVQPGNVQPRFRNAERYGFYGPQHMEGKGWQQRQAAATGELEAAAGPEVAVPEQQQQL